MISVRRIAREDWERKFRAYGCYPQDGLTNLNTAEWWRWPFKGPPFTIPVNKDGSLDEWAYQHLITDMARLAPPDFEFPDPFNDPAE